MIRFGCVVLYVFSFCTPHFGRPNTNNIQTEYLFSRPLLCLLVNAVCSWPRRKEGRKKSITQYAGVTFRDWRDPRVIFFVSILIRCFSYIKSYLSFVCLLSRSHVLFLFFVILIYILLQQMFSVKVFFSFPPISVLFSTKQLRHFIFDVQIFLSVLFFLEKFATQQ